MIKSVAVPEPSLDGGAQLARHWEPLGPVQADIVLVHGLGEHSGRYEGTGSLLAEAGYRVKGFDLLGFGASSGERADIARWALFLDQVEDNLRSVRTEGRRLILMGHSVGGLIALDYALAERPPPDLLILSAPALAGGKAWRKAVAPTLARLFPTLLVPARISGDQLSRDPRVGEAYFRDPLVLTKASARLGASIFSTQDRLRNVMSALAIPTLVIHGGQDTLIPTASSEPLGSIPGVTRRVFPDLRHEAMNEPEGPEVVAEIVGWIASQTA